VGQDRDLAAPSSHPHHIARPQRTQGAFYDNVARLPLDDTSLFVRSVTSDISIRLDIPIPDQPAKWRTFVTPIGQDLEGVESGKIKSYRGLFVR
jgi:hypothetical protein